jgi:phosphoglycolate phosphatase
MAKPGQDVRAAVIFDLDGTLADTSADLVAAANVCLRDLGEAGLLDPVADAVTAFQGGRAMLRLGFSRAGLVAAEAEVDREYRRFLASYEAGIDRETRVYPGAVEAVEALRAGGWVTGICTNKPEHLARLLLERLGIAGLFGSVVGADTFPVRKPDPLPYRAAVERAGGVVARSILVGDTVIDRLTGIAAGVPVVLVTFGPEGASVARHLPEALLHRFGDLPEVASRLIAG